MRLTFLQVYIHVWKHLEKGLQGYTSTVNGVSHSQEGGLRGGISLYLIFVVVVTVTMYSCITYEIKEKSILSM